MHKCLLPIVCLIAPAVPAAFATVYVSSPGNGSAVHTIYAVGLLGSGMNSSGRDALQRLADGTGGAAYFPEGLTQVTSITRAIAHDIRSQYIVAYKPRNQNTRPSFQSVRAEARAPGMGHLTVRTMNGYYPGAYAR